MRGLLLIIIAAPGCGEPPALGGDGSSDSSEGSTTESPPPAEATTGSPPTTSGTTSAADSSGAGEGGGSSSGAPPPPTCQLDTPLPGPMSERTLSHDGVDRSYVLHVPPGYDHRTPTPVVFAFHGYSNSPALQEQWSQMSAKAAEAGFILVYPYGTGLVPGWNAGDCCLTGTGVDDVSFVSAMIDQLDSELCIDPRRVYATGFSNGGFLSHRLACELSDRIAAIAPVAGVMGIDGCAPSRPMPVLHMHGTLDLVVPYNGSVLIGYEPVADTIADWVERDACRGAPVVSYQSGDVTCERYESCDAGAEVELCTIEGGGHTWPGGANIIGGGATTQDISANDYLWDFFMAHPLP